MRILYLVTDDWYFWSHRFSLALSAQRSGADVYVMTHLNHLGEKLREKGFHVIDWHCSRGSLNPFQAIIAILQVWQVYRRVKPDLVHHVALKPIVFGGLAARLRDIPSVNAVAGLGYVFINNSFHIRLLRQLLLFLLRLTFSSPGSCAVLQNAEDLDVLKRMGALRNGTRAEIIAGSGVDVSAFQPSVEVAGQPMVVLASRMLWDKGVKEFVEAATTLRDRMKARFVLVGSPDPSNRAAIPEPQLRGWADSGVIEWWGHREDMAAVFCQAHIVCLPSYREGLPKVLLEACAAGRPIVATDVSGCRDVVRHGVNGLLVPPRNSEALADAFALLLADVELRRRMGARGRELAVQEFSSDVVARRTLAVYESLVSPTLPMTAAQT